MTTFQFAITLATIYLAPVAPRLFCIVASLALTIIAITALALEFL